MAKLQNMRGLQVLVVCLIHFRNCLVTLRSHVQGPGIS